MGLGKTYSADYLIDSNGNTGASGQVLISTATGIDWADGSAITGGPFLPLSAGSSYPLTGDLYIEEDSLYLLNASSNYWRVQNNSSGKLVFKQGTTQRGIWSSSELQLANNLIVDNKIGVGTTSPQAFTRVDVRSGNSDGNAAIAAYGYNGVGGYAIMGHAYAVDNTHAGSATGLRGISNGGRTVSGSVNIGGYFTASGSENNYALITDAGNVGIGTASPSVPLAVEGVASMGSNSRLSMGILDINSSATPTQILIQTTIPWNSGAADFTVNIKGFVYGTDESCNLSIHWHYYNNVPYNANITSSGSWAPIAKLHSSDATTPANGFVQIHLLSPGYWPKIYVESMYSSSYNDLYASGWSWSDAAGTGTAYALDYNKDFGNNFVMTDPGNVGIGETTPTSKLEVRSETATHQLVSLNRAASPTAAMYLGNDSGNNAVISSNYSDLIFGRDQSSTLSEWMRIKRDGNVGIGTTSPQSKLHIETGSGGTYNPNTNHDDVTIEGSGNIGLQLFSPASSYQYIAFGDPDSVNAGYLRYYHGTNEMVFRTNGGDRMVIDSSGEVGIGTTSPGAKLDVVVSNVSVTPNGDSSGVFRNNGHNYISILSGDTSEGGIIFGNSADAADGYIAYKHGTGAADQAFAFGTANGERMRITKDGNVGINTTNPIDKLNVHGGTGDAATQQPKIAVTRTSSTGNVLAGKMIVTTKPTDPTNHGNLVFQVKTTASSGESSAYYTDAITIDGKNANVGIGTARPDYKLTINNDAANTNNPALYVKNPNSNTTAVIAEFVGDSDSIQIKNIGTGDYAIYNSQQSNGIALFDGSGGVEIRYAGTTTLESDSTGGIKVTGQLSATGDVVAYSSDERLKENIKPIESAVDKIKQLKGVTFDWNEKSEELGFEPTTKTNDVGVIAQDVEAVFPQLVQLAPFDIARGEDGNATSKSGEDYKTVNYARLTAVLIEAVKEQQQQIDELKKQIK